MNGTGRIHGMFESRGFSSAIHGGGASINESMSGLQSLHTWIHLAEPHQRVSVEFWLITNTSPQIHSIMPWCRLPRNLLT